jgi:hypothetical protein
MASKTPTKKQVETAIRKLWPEFLKELGGINERSVMNADIRGDIDTIAINTENGDAISDIFDYWYEGPSDHLGSEALVRLEEELREKNGAEGFFEWESAAVAKWCN